MKVNIGNYVNRWTCKLHDSYMYRKYGVEWPDKQSKLENYIEGLENVLQWVYNHSINLWLDRKKRKICVKIHPYDAWNGFHTLSLIILPLFKEVRAQKQGSPWVDDEDAPEEFSSKNCPRKNNWDWDENVHKRWEYAINEMIWAFEQINNEDADDVFFTGKSFNKEGYEKWQARKQNALRLFAKYFESICT